MDLPNFKLYFVSCWLVWMKQRALLRNRRPLELERHDLRFEWHGYLWYNKAKVNIDFKNHDINTNLGDAQNPFMAFYRRSIL